MRVDYLIEIQPKCCTKMLKIIINDWSYNINKNPWANYNWGVGGLLLKFNQKLATVADGGSLISEERALFRI